MLPRLAIANLLARRVRTALTVAAVALAVSLIVSVSTGFNSVEKSVRDFFGQFIGMTDFVITRVDDPVRGVPESLVQQLRADSRVQQVAGRIEASLPMPSRVGTPAAGGLHAVVGDKLTLFGIDVENDENTPRLVKQLDAGRFLTPGDHGKTVIDQGLADALDAKVGDTLSLSTPKGATPFQIVGITHKPGIFSSVLRTAYVPLAEAQPLIFGDARVTTIKGEFAGEVDGQQFADAWADFTTDPQINFTLTAQRWAELDRNLMSMRLLSYFGSSISMLAAAFIVFSTLSMGVAEQQRVLAMMRAIGLLRGQVFRLVVLEGLLLGAAGVGVGVPLGVLWVFVLTLFYPRVFTSGVALDSLGITISAAVTMAAALGASLLPALGAMRASPLEAMAPQADAGTKFPLRLTLLGLLLAGIDSALMFIPWQNILPDTADYTANELARSLRFFGHFALGLPTLMLGFFLLSPLFVWLIEAVGAPIASVLFGVRRELLRQQLSRGIWRAAGTASALMVGLAVLVVMQCQGRSSIAAWRLPDRFPDVFIYSPLGTMDVKQQNLIRRTPGVIPDSVLPIATFNPRLGDSVWAMMKTQFMPESTMFIAFDPDRAFDVIELTFREGNRQDAQRLLKQGRHLLITEEFKKAKGYGVGDMFPLETRDGKTIEYTVAGVVWSPGIDVMVNTFDLSSQFEQRSAACVFGSMEDARNDFGITAVRLAAADLELGLNKLDVLADLRERVGVFGMNIADVRQLKADIQGRARDLLLVASAVAWCAMLVASLGVTNTIMAGVRTRRWQFGVLRAIGTTAGQLQRLVLAEAVLLGIVGASLGLAAGLLMFLNAHQLSVAVLGFDPPMVIPWGIITLGMGAVVAVAVLGSAWPVWSVGRADPLTLLQAGRSST